MPGPPANLPPAAAPSGAPPVEPFSRRTRVISMLVLLAMAALLFPVNHFIRLTHEIWAFVLAALMALCFVLSGPLLALSGYNVTTFFSGISLPGIPISMNQVVGVMALAAWGLWVAAGRTRIPPRSRYATLVILAAVYYILNSLLGESFEMGLLMARSLLICVLLTLVLATSLVRPFHWTFWLWSLLAVTCMMTSIGLLEFATHLDFFPKQKWQVKPLETARINGVSRDAIVYGYYALWALGPGLYLAMESRRVWQRLLAIALTLPLLAGALLTFNRQTPVILLAMLIAAAFLFRHRMVRPLTIALLGAMLLASPYVAVKMGKRLTRVGQIQADPSYMIRRDKALIMLQMIRRHPIMGIGLESFTKSWPDYLPPNPYYIHFFKPREHHPDLGYLQITAESGFVGLGFCLAVMGSGAAILLRRRREALAQGAVRMANLCSGLLIILVQMAIAEIIQDVFLHPRNWWLWGMIAIIAVRPRQEIVEENAAHSPAPPDAPAAPPDSAKNAPPPDLAEEKNTR